MSATVKGKDEYNPDLYVPLLNRDDYVPLHPAMNFMETPLIGVWLPGKNSENGDVRQMLWMWDGKNLKSFDSMIKLGGYVPKTEPITFKPRVSAEILAKYDFFSEHDAISERDKTPIDVPALPTTPLRGEYDVYTNSIYIYILQISSTLNSLYTQIKRKYSVYLDAAEEDITILSLWTAATYYTELFDAFPYLFINGVKRAGKSTSLKLLEKLCFNAVMTGSTTASATFRIIDSFKPTLLIDETDGLNSNRNKPELHVILLNGYKKGAQILRSMRKDENSDFKTRYFDAYCPKALVNIKGLEDTLEDRTIYINFKRTFHRDFSERATNMDKDPEWPILRDCLYLALFMHWENVRDVAATMESTAKISNREFEIWKPLLVIAKLAGIYDEVEKIAIGKINEKQVEDTATQLDTIMVEALDGLIKKDGFYTVKEIMAAYRAKFSEGEMEKLSGKWVGNCLRRLGFKKATRVGSGIRFFIRISEVTDMAQRMLPPKDERDAAEKQATSEAGEMSKQDFIKAQCKDEIKVSYLFKLFVEKFGQEKELFFWQEIESLKKLGIIFEPTPETAKLV